VPNLVAAGELRTVFHSTRYRLSTLPWPAVVLVGGQDEYLADSHVYTASMWNVGTGAFVFENRPATWTARWDGMPIVSTTLVAGDVAEVGNFSIQFKATRVSDDHEDMLPPVLVDIIEAVD